LLKRFSRSEVKGQDHGCNGGDMPFDGVAVRLSCFLLLEFVIANNNICVFIISAEALA